jgi:alkylation response protein AidB-like acyl-CoA dehydrogenase
MAAFGAGTQARSSGTEEHDAREAQVNGATAILCLPDGSSSRFSGSKIFTIFEGTSEIQRMIIGSAVTGLDVRNNRRSWSWCGS